jgi:geranylgeranyl diphosphate synthase type II
LVKSLELANSVQAEQLRSWFRTENPDPITKIEAVTALYDQIGVRGFCEAKIAQYTNLAIKSLSVLDVEDEKKNGLRTIIEQLMNREM